MLPAFQVLGEIPLTYWPPLVTLMSTTTLVAVVRSPVLRTLMLNWMGPQPEGVREALAPSPTRPVEEPTPVGPAGPAAAGDATKGSAIFASSCAGCHGADASGGALGPTLVSSEVAANDDGFFREAIANGRPGSAMPPWSGVLSAQNIEDVIAFLRAKP